ncbi:unnamed protein product [Spodoptera exigua]|nr:unnamed protein product [Spodoptera exigua]
MLVASASTVRQGATPGLPWTATLSFPLGIPFQGLLGYVARTPSERVPYPSLLAALDLSVDWAFVAFLQKLYVGDCLGPVNSENAGLRISTRKTKEIKTVVKNPTTLLIGTEAVERVISGASCPRLGVLKKTSLQGSQKPELLSRS